MSELSEGVTIEELEDDVSKKFLASQQDFEAFVRFQPYNQVLPRVYKTVEKRVKQFEVRPDDVWIASFPKCGTTWTQEMVWCLMNDFDFEGAGKSRLDDRVPYLELEGVTDPFTVPKEVFDTIPSIEDAAAMPSPRILKTHLSIDMIPNGIMEKSAKLIYVTRNPRDACVSLYNHWRILEGYTGSFEEFADAFLHDVAGYYTPFFANVLGYWKAAKHSDNLLFLTYEEMQANLAVVVTKVCDFLGKEVPRGDLMERLLEHLSFDKMKNNTAVNKVEFVEMFAKLYNVDQPENCSFMHKGKTGTWRERLSPELIRRFEQWEIKWLEGSDFKNDYE